jgi:hypothetical protein
MPKKLCTRVLHSNQGGEYTGKEMQEVLRKWGNWLICMAVMLYNCTPSVGNGGKTLYELYYGEKPDLAHVHQFGATVCILIPSGQGASLMTGPGQPSTSGQQERMSDITMCGFPTLRQSVKRGMYFLTSQVGLNLRTGTWMVAPPPCSPARDTC